MYVKLGTHQFADNTVTLRSLTSNYRRGSRGRVDRIVKRIVLNGDLIASSQAAIRTKIIAFEAAIEDGRDIGLYHDDNSKSAHFFDNAQSVSGVRVISFGYPDGDASEYATARTFDLTLEAEFLPTSFDGLKSFREELTFQGNGGPRRVLIVTLNGIQAQTTNPRTIQRISQIGSAVGISAYPSVPSPIFGKQQDNERHTIKKTGPTLDGRLYTDYGVQWSYAFLSARALNANPHFQ